MTIRGQSGGGTVTQQVDAANQQALPDAVIRAVTALGQQVAALYGTPQDIEWGWAEDKLYLLQARPITSLYPLPQATFPEPIQVYFSFGAIQGMLDPMTPLGQDAIQIVFAGGARLFDFAYTLETQSLLLAAGERLWVRTTAVLRNRVGRQGVRKVLGVIEPSIGQAVDSLLAEAAFAAGGPPQPATLRHMVSFVGTLLPTLVRTVRDPDAQRQAVQDLVETRLAQAQAQMAAATTLAHIPQLKFDQITV